MRTLKTFQVEGIESPASTLSELIRMALEDMRTIARDPEYRYYPHTWHDPGKPCRVCLAGSVLARRSDIEPGAILSGNIPGWMRALDYIRSGQPLAEALKYFRGPHVPGIDEETKEQLNEIHHQMSKRHGMWDHDVKPLSFRGRLEDTAAALARMGL